MDVPLPVALSYIGTFWDMNFLEIYVIWKQNSKKTHRQLCIYLWDSLHIAVNLQTYPFHEIIDGLDIPVKNVYGRK